MMIRQEIRVWLIHLFYVFFFLFLINRIFFPSSGMAERSMSYVLYPFFKIHANLTQSLQQQAQDRQTLQGMHKELSCLRIENDLLKGRIAQLQAQQYFIDDTRELVDFARGYEIENKQVAKILWSCCSPQEDIIFIDGGSNKNCLKDDIVVYKNAIIGRIVEVYPWYSKVALITDLRCRIAARVGDDASGICCGKNNKELELSFVPHYKPVMVGDIVFSTGQGMVYPQGFALGVVQSVVTDLVSHTIVVKPQFEIANISYVYVLHKGASQVAVPASSSQDVALIDQVSH